MAALAATRLAQTPALGSIGGWGHEHDSASPKGSLSILQNGRRPRNWGPQTKMSSPMLALAPWQQQAAGVAPRAVADYEGLSWRPFAPSPTSKRQQNSHKQKRLKVRASANPAAEGSPPTKSGLMADKDVQTLTYGLLAALTAVCAVTSLVLPAETVAVLLNAQPTGLSVSAVRASGASLIPIAVSLQCLKDAAAHDRLSSNTYKRLNLAVIFFWAIVLWIVVAAKLQLLLPPVPFGILTAVSVVGTALPWLISSATGASLVALYKEFSSAYGTVLKPVGATSAAYGLFSAACYALGAGLFYFPHHFQLHYPALQGIPLAVPDFFWQMLANVYYASSVLFFVLKDAAERGRLAASTFKNLNASFAAASLLILWNLASEFQKLQHNIGDVGVGWVFQMIVLAFVFVVTSYNYLTAKKKK